MKSPDFIVPENIDYNKLELVESLTDANNKVLKAVMINDLTEMVALSDDHPLKGSTKLEIVHFITYHTMRHNYQIKKIKEAVN